MTISSIRGCARRRKFSIGLFCLNLTLEDVVRTWGNYSGPMFSCYFLMSFFHLNDLCEGTPSRGIVRLFWSQRTKTAAHSTRCLFLWRRVIEHSSKTGRHSVIPWECDRFAHLRRGVWRWRKWSLLWCWLHASMIRFCCCSPHFHQTAMMLKFVYISSHPCFCNMVGIVRDSSSSGKLWSSFVEVIISMCCTSACVGMVTCRGAMVCLGWSESAMWWTQQNLVKLNWLTNPIAIQ